MVRVVLVLIALGLGQAHAAPAPRTRVAQVEGPRTTTAVAVRRRPNAKARAVIVLPAQTVVKVGAETAGWVAITATVGRRTITGFVPRTALVVPKHDDDDDASEDNFAAVAAVEPRTTIDAVVVRAKPGEKQATIATLPRATTVTVLGERGRWLRIRAGTTVGYVTRTTITGPAPATEIVTPPQTPAPPPTPPVPGWGDAHRARPSTAAIVYATRAAQLRAEAQQAAAIVGEVATGAALDVLDARTTSGWVKVRDEQQRIGWVVRAEVGNGSAQAAIDAPPIAAVARTSERTRAPPSKRLLVRVDAGLGYRTLGMDFTSPGDGLANYAADAVAAAGGLDADVSTRRGRLVLGADARGVGSLASPGLRYTGPTAPPGEIRFSTLAVDAGVRAGVRLRDRFDIAARVGAHYDAFVTADVDNAGTLPRERLLGATLGARLDVSPPASRVTATVRFDVLVIGDRAQTAGLEDGMSSTANALWGSATLRYRLADHVALQLGLELGRATTTWSGMSVRTPGVTHAQRVDRTQLLQLGLSLEL